MATRPNGYYNDPQLGAAFSNLAAAFAPPSGSDLAGYATASATKEKAQRLAELFSYAKDPTYDQTQADRMGVLGGLYTPNQSYYSVDRGNAVTMRGQDVTAKSNLDVAGLNNQNEILKTLLTPVSENASRFVPGQVQNQYGLPAIQSGNVSAAQGETVNTADGRVIAGQAKPLSETEFNAQQLARLLGNGQLTDTMIADNYQGQRTPVEAVGPDGSPIYMSPGAAVSQGATPYNKPTGATKNAIAVMPGTNLQVPAVQGDDGRWKHAQTGEDLPADIQIHNLPTPTGNNADLGLSKPVNAYLERSIIDAQSTRNTVDGLLDLVTKSPASQGMVGSLRGTVQNLVQTGGEVGRLFGADMNRVQNEIAAGSVNGVKIDPDVAAQFMNFDPNIPAIEMMSNLLAFQYAKTLAGDRISNEMLRNAKAALGLDGWTGNQADTIARLNQVKQQLFAQETLLKQQRGDGSLGGAPTPPVAAAIPNSTAAVQSGDDQAPAGVDPEDWKYMSPEDKALFRQ